MRTAHDPPLAPPARAKLSARALALHAASLAPWALALLSSCGPALPKPPAPEDTCSGRLAGELVISEILPDPTGVDSGRQYVELYNSTERDIELGGITLYYSALGATSAKRVTLPSATLPGRGYLALADVPAGTAPMPAGIGAGYGGGLGALRHSGGILDLRCGDELIDEATYLAADVGRSLEFDGASPPDAADNDLPERWCSALTPLDPLDPERGEFGTPGAPNGVCGAAPPARCVDASTGELRDAVAPAPGDLVISELMAAPAAVDDENGEWMELHALADVDLNALVVRAGSSTATVSAASCLRVDSGAYALLARNPETLENGGLPPVAASAEFRLTNDASSVVISSGDTRIDAFAWSAPRPGVAWQLSPGALDAPADERLAAWCPATPTYGDGDRGTPGAPNPPCPVLAADGECIDEQSGEARRIERPQPGDLVITEIMAHPSVVSDAAGEWFEIAARRRVDLNGLELANAGTGHAKLELAACAPIESGSRVLFARVTDPESNGGLPAVGATFSFALANTGTQSVIIRSDSEVIDRVDYDSVTQGASIQLAPSDGAGGAAWCVTPAGQTYGRGDRGSPGAANVPCEAYATEAGAGGGGGASGAGGGGRCRDVASGVPRDPVQPEPGDLIISEIMAAPTIGNNGPGEWFEVRAAAAVDLNGVELANQGGRSVTLASPDCMSVKPGDWLLFARSADPTLNGSLPPVSATFSFPLADSGTDAYPERALMLAVAGRELDRVTWTASDKGVSLQLSTSALASQVDEAAERWCATPEGVTFGGSDRGTPAASNVSCP